MSTIKNKNHILTTIDQIRSRKSRPDVNRICKYMLKFYKVSPKETKADLRRCVKERSILKVDYKDNVSYRNAANWRRDKKTTAQLKKMSTTTLTSEKRIITSAIATLIYQDQRYLEDGIPFEDLIKASLSQSNKYTKKQLENIVNKDLNIGTLVKLPNGNLALGPADDPDTPDSMRYEYNADSNTKMTSSANSSCRSSPLRMRGRPKKRGGASGHSSTAASTSRNAGVRVGERRKMAKKVFDPSDNNLPSKRKRGRPVGSLNKSTLKKRLQNESPKRDNRSMPRSESRDSMDASEDEAEAEDTNVEEAAGGVCSVCLVQKARGSTERLVECRDCSNKAHAGCLQASSGILKLRPDNTWQCPHCKTCVVCCETNDAGVLTVCSVCSDAYHALCHTPRIPERQKAWDQWECNNCLESRPGVTGSPVIPNCIMLDSSDTLPFLKPNEIEISYAKNSDNVPIDPSIPDITKWTSDDVYKYFSIHFPQAASIFKEQEMDGQALSLARRTDIVRGLGLPLGPALTLYRIVVKLQTRKDDWTMCWG